MRSWLDRLKKWIFFLYSVQRLSEAFLIPKTIQQDIIIILYIPVRQPSRSTTTRTELWNTEHYTITVPNKWQWYYRKSRHRTTRSQLQNTVSYTKVCLLHVSDNNITVSYTRQLTVLTRSTNNCCSTLSDSPCTAEDVILIGYEHIAVRKTRQFHELVWCFYVIWVFIYWM